MALPGNEYCMNPEPSSERWSHLDQLFCAALECEPEARDTFVAEACCGDELLRHELESLLASHLEAKNFLEQPVFNLGMKLLVTHEAESLLGRRLGPYRIVTLIGSGGMGAVYLASRDDDEYQKRVAIKVIKRGMDTEFILRRFRQERQIIANLDHPNIARLLDGGTTEDGLPYFVMEYVEGERVDRYCDSHELPIIARLALFRDVCAAVQYAHQNLVIHRDIKPSNILVTSDGIPKLLDFGIAKLLSSEPQGESTRLSLTDIRLMTPEYASPEQVRGGPITTASDVYSLGALLYVLLCGHHPYDLKSCHTDEMTRVICETEPEKPSAAVTRREDARSIEEVAKLTPEIIAADRSADRPETLRKQLSGDLDNIVLKAIQKEPQRRYGYAAQLSSDIGRHLSGLPVAAHPDTLAYRAAKFVRRNRVSVAAAAAIVLVLAAGILVSAWEARVANLQRARAERRYHDMREVADSLILDMPAAIESGPTKARAMLAEKAVSYLSNLDVDSPDDAALKFDLAKSYVMLGQARNVPGYSNLGDASGALESFQKGISILQMLVSARPNDRQVRLYLARTYDGIALTLMETDVARSLEMHQRALATVSASDPRDLELQLEIANTSELLGERYGHPYYSNCGDTQRAIDYIGRSLQMMAELDRLASGNDSIIDPFYHRLLGDTKGGYRQNLATSYNRMAGLLWATGELTKAVEYENKGIELLKSVVTDPNSRTLKSDLGVRLIRLANFLEENGQYAEALRKTEAVSAIFEPYARSDRENVAYRRALAVNYNRKGSVLVKIGRPEEAVKAFRHASTFSLELSGATPQDPETRDRLADSFEGMARAFASGGRLNEAQKSCDQALEMRGALFELDPRNARYRSHLGFNYLRLGDVYGEQRKWNEALENYEKAIAILDAMSTADPINWLLLRARADAYSKIGDTERAIAITGAVAGRKPRLDAARSWYERSLKLWRNMQSEGKLDFAHSAAVSEVTRRVKSIAVR